MLCYAMELQCSYQPGLSTLHLDKKHLRSVTVFLDVTVNQVGSQHELLTSVKRRKVREYVSVVYECICSSTPIKVKRSEKLRNVKLSKNLELNDILSLFSCDRGMCLLENETHV